MAGWESERFSERVGTDGPGNRLQAADTFWKLRERFQAHWRRERLPPRPSHPNPTIELRRAYVEHLFTNDVRQTLDQFRRSVDQMFDNFYGNAAPTGAIASGERTWTFSPVLETGWNDNFLNLRAILPGVSEKDVRVSVQHSQLVIEGERKTPEGFEKNAYTQLAYGKF